MGIWTLNSSCTMVSNFKATAGPQNQAKNVQYFRVLSLKLINVHSAREAECFMFRKLISLCSVFLWGPLEDRKLFFPCQSLPWSSSFLFNWFCLLAWFCHSSSSGFSPPPHSTHCFCVDTSVFCNLCNMKGKKTSFLHFIVPLHTLFSKSDRNISLVILHNTISISSVFLFWVYTII